MAYFLEAKNLLTYLFENKPLDCRKLVRLKRFIQAAPQKMKNNLSISIASLVAYNVIM